MLIWTYYGLRSKSFQLLKDVSRVIKSARKDRSKMEPFYMLVIGNWRATLDHSLKTMSRTWA